MSAVPLPGGGGSAILRPMKAVSYRPPGRGPFRADQIRPGDPYELSDGHAIVSEPSGRRHGRKHLVGGAALATDPAVEDVGVEVGHVLDEGTLRAPDVSVGGFADGPGFARTPPALAVEYVEGDADEADLERKIAELLGAGAELVWVVRLAGERRVEVHGRSRAVIVKHAGSALEAPGILRNPVPVESLYDRAAAHALMLRNLLQRAGYADLDAVRAEGRAAGRAEGRAEGEALGHLAHARALLRRTFARRCLAVGAAQMARIERCTDLATLDAWLEAAHTVSTVGQALRSR